MDDALHAGRIPEVADVKVCAKPLSHEFLHGTHVALPFMSNVTWNRSAMSVFNIKSLDELRPKIVSN